MDIDFGEMANINVKQEKRHYAWQKFAPTTFSYVLFLFFFMLGLDIFRGSPKSLAFYFSVIPTLSCLMALVELLYFRVVVKVAKYHWKELKARIEALGFEKTDQHNSSRRSFTMRGRKYFFRSLDMSILETDDHYLLNINIFHLRYFKRLVDA